MSGAAIVIEIAASDAASPYAAALVEACSRGSHANMSCVLPTDTDSSAPPMVAVVTWADSEHRDVEVQVGARRTTGPEWSNRHLSFGVTDAEIERWRAVGLVIATLAGEVAASNPEPPKVEPKLEPVKVAAPLAPPPPAARPANAARLPAWTLQAAAELARGSSSSFAAYGGSIRLTRLLVPRWLFGTAAARYDVQNVTGQQLNLSWTSFALGAGAALPLASGHVALEAGLAPEVSFVRADLNHAAPGSGAQGGTLWSLREGVGAVWWWTEWLGLAAAADLVESNRATVVHAQAGSDATRELARVQALTWSAGLGLRVGFGTR